ncbi:hypothetical protein IscW_ISCW004218, partial [Ixodes scapularis]
MKTEADPVHFRNPVQGLPSEGLRREREGGRPVREDRHLAAPDQVLGFHPRRGQRQDHRRAQVEGPRRSRRQGPLQGHHRGECKEVLHQPQEHSRLRLRYSEIISFLSCNQGKIKFDFLK